MNSEIDRGLAIFVSAVNKNRAYNQFSDTLIKGE